MFRKCEIFNQSLNNWDVSNIVYMNSMFAVCVEFNQPLDKWNTSKVKNISGDI